MKKLLMIIMALLVLGGCRKNIVYDQRDGELADMSWYEIEDGSFCYADIETFRKLFADKKTTIVYIGYEECPWCRELCPVLDEYLKEYEFKAYYYDIQIGDNGSTENLTEIEQMLLEKLEKDEDGKPILYSPTIVYLQQGKVYRLHEGTVNSHNARERKMTEREMERLRFQLSKEFEGMMGKYE
ncbi:MAG: hypothetical protein IJG59_08820 [Erysipelotrichaceae bacterium]|nr:hypothetical protein [Erysipelotrichaceae bacterium]